MDKILFNIRRIREQKGFSQEYMAEVLGISQASYARMENMETKITIDRLKKIAEILETNIEDVLHTEERNTDDDDIIGYYEEEEESYIQNLISKNEDTLSKLITSYEERIQDYRLCLEKKNEEIEFMRQLLLKVTPNKD